MKRDDKAKAGFVGVKSRKRAFELTEAARRRLPQVPANLRSEVDEARERLKDRPASPGAKVYVRKDGGHFIDAPHRDLEAWEVQICDAFGTRSHSAMWVFLGQISNLCQNRGRRSDDGDYHWVPDEYELNFIIATIQAERPETPMQASMLAQMIANHMMQMRIAGDILGRSGDYVPPDRAATFAKLTNAFANQAEVYLKMRGRAPKQSVAVTYRKETHVYHYARSAHAPGGGGSSSTSQSCEATEVTYVAKSVAGADSVPALKPPGRSKVRCEDPAGVVVPMRGVEGQVALPAPRRSRGRAEG